MAQIRVDVWDPALETEQLDELTSGLRLELLDAGVPNVPAVDEIEPPPGARAVDVAAIGSVIVTLAGGIALLRETLTLVREWRARHRTVGVRIKLSDREIELTGASEQTEARLVEAFLAGAERE